MKTLPLLLAIPAHGQPLFLSFMTYNLPKAAAAMRQAGVRILKEVEHHPAWSGSDLIVTDVDGNVIQIFAFDEMSRSSPD